MDSSFSSTNPRYPNMNRPSEYSSASGLELRSSPTSGPTSAYLASPGSLHARHAELLELQQLASQRRARSRARLADGYQDVKYGKRDLESSTYTSVTGPISRTKKNIPAHTCDICKPARTFTRAEYLRCHQLSHQMSAYSCPFEDCARFFLRPDLLARHLHRHETGELPYKYKRADPSSVEAYWYSSEITPERLTSSEDFGGGFSKAGLTQLSTPPRNPFLSVPVPYTQENSPWCSDASDSEYSSGSDGSPGRLDKVAQDRTYPTRSDGPGNPLDKFTETFKKMEGKAWNSSAKFLESALLYRRTMLLENVLDRRSCLLSLVGENPVPLLVALRNTTMEPRSEVIRPSWKHSSM